MMLDVPHTACTLLLLLQALLLLCMLTALDLQYVYCVGLTRVLMACILVAALVHIAMKHDRYMLFVVGE